MTDFFIYRSIYIYTYIYIHQRDDAVNWLQSAKIAAHYITQKYPTQRENHTWKPFSTWKSPTFYHTVLWSVFAHVAVAFTSSNLLPSPFLLVVTSFFPSHRKSLVVWSSIYKPNALWKRVESPNCFDFRPLSNAWKSSKMFLFCKVLLFKKSHLLNSVFGYCLCLFWIYFNDNGNSINSTFNRHY